LEKNNTLKEPEIPEPSKPVITKSGNLDIIESKPVITEPVNPLIIEPAKSVMTEPVKPVIKKHSKHESSVPLKPVINEPEKPVINESTKQLSTELFKPVIKEPAKDLKIETEKQVTMEPSKPIKTEHKKPEKTELPKNETGPEKNETGYNQSAKCLLTKPHTIGDNQTDCRMQSVRESDTCDNNIKSNSVTQPYWPSEEAIKELQKKVAAAFEEDRIERLRQNKPPQTKPRQKPIRKRRKKV